MDSSPPSSRPAAPLSPNQAKLRLHDGVGSAAAAARHSIIHSSAKGWSPLHISKRGGESAPGTPLRQQDNGEGPRRTSSSFRHMATNSLVAKSPFKDLSTREGAMSNGMKHQSPEVIHERRTPSRQPGQIPKTATGSTNTPKASIGLGINTTPRSRGSPTTGAAVSGTRRASSERKVAIPSSGDRRSSAERKVSGSKENESPDRGSPKKRRVPRQSLAYKLVVDGEYVTHSPFRNPNAAPEEIELASPTMDEILSTPSRRVSGGNSKRHVSPSANLRMSDSPSSSPQRNLSGSLPVPSPLREQMAAAPSPTPTKSSLASSKRLLGPRGQSSILDSPSRKTVTFQAVPDVKEFDRMSVEGSVDGSFDATGDDDEWTDDGEQARGQRNTSQDSEDAVGDESATADFMDSLIEEGLFSPPELETAVFADHADFELPMESSPRPDLDATSSSSVGQLLSTPPVGNETPLMPNWELPAPSSPEHVHTITPHLNPGEQPKLPHSDDHSMLLNGDASLPLTHPSPAKASDGPHAHQQGGLYDPFITIQTATDIAGEHKERSEGGVPLGRTSHSERVHAARLLATQKLGRGFPSAPPKIDAAGQSSGESDSDSYSAKMMPPAEASQDVFGSVISSPAIRKVSTPRKVSNRSAASPAAKNRQVSDVPELSGPSSRMSQFKQAKSANTTPKAATPSKRNLPKPPPPAALDLPEPVGLLSGDEASESEAESDVPSRALHSPSRSNPTRAGLSLNELPYSLPAFGVTPLISEDPVFTGAKGPVEESYPPAPVRRVSEVAPKLELSSDATDLKSAVETEVRAGSERRVSAIAPKLELSPDLADNSQLDLAVNSESEGQWEDERETASEAEDPLTPPPGLRRSEREESPRIPSFEFGGLSLDMPKSEEAQETTPETPKPTTVVTAPSPSTPQQESAPSTPTRNTPGRTTPTAALSPGRNTPSRTSSPLSANFVASDSNDSIAGEFGPAADKDVSDASTTTRVRQRISRDAIRETVTRRVQAEGARPVSMIDAPRPVAKAAPTRPLSAGPGTPTKGTFAPPSPAFKSHKRGGSTSSIDKELPPAPDSPKVFKNATSPTRTTPVSALHQLNTRKDSPKSALDRIANIFDDGDSTLSSSPATSPVVQSRVVSSPSKSVPVGILRKPETAAAASIAPSVAGSIVNDPKALSSARRSRRRSASTGDADSGSRPRLSLGIDADGESILESVQDEFEHVSSNRGYRVRERQRQVRATYGVESKTAGSLEAGRAWRPLRRPSDMNEHSKEIRLAREREQIEGKASGTIFVKVLGIEALNLPVPKEPTHFCITLDNGIDYIRTPYAVLTDDACINQEFSLVEHPNFEFSLSLDIRRDPHIVRAVQERDNPRSTGLLEPPRSHSPLVSSLTGKASGGGFRALFQSPRKSRHQRTESAPAARAPARAAAPVRQAETIATYLDKATGTTVAKTHIALKPIARQCESKILEIRYPMFAMFKGASLPDGTASRKQVAKITIQMLRLPPLPGLKPEELPGSIDETLKGLRWHKWHSQVFHEGTLTQVGGDCRVPRRRMFRLAGGSLVAINEVTKKEVTSIDLRLATALVDVNGPTSPKMNDDDYDPYGARPRSFKLVFEGGECIVLSADKDEDKLVWMDMLSTLIGKIPANPLWAEMLAEYEKTQELRTDRVRIASSTSIASKRSKNGGPRKSSRSTSQHLSHHA